MANVTDSLQPQTVLAWIKEHPDFFSQHPELLAMIEWPSDTPSASGTTSLQDFQVRRLKADVHKLQDQLQTLSQVAKNNERLMLRLHAMTLALMEPPHPSTFVAQLIKTLRGKFDAHAVALHLHHCPDDLGAVAEVIQWNAAALAWIKPIEPINTPQCGRFTVAKIKSLFPNDASTIQSAATVPIQSLGILAIGSTDQSKFQPQMGTLFLELLATTIHHCLSAHNAPNQSAQ